MSFLFGLGDYPLCKLRRRCSRSAMLLPKENSHRANPKLRRWKVDFLCTSKCYPELGLHRSDVHTLTLIDLSLDPSLTSSSKNALIPPLSPS